MSEAERIKDAVRVEDYIQSRCPQLKRAGTLYKMNCPRHADKTPSFVVNPEAQTWKDYGACGAGGDVIAFVMWYDGVDFGEALHTLADYAHITLEPLTPASKEKADKRERMYVLMEKAMQFFHEDLVNSESRYNHTWQYLRHKRGLSQETIVNAKLGCAFDNPRSIYENFCLDYSDNELIAVGLCKRSEKGDMYDTFRNRLMIPMMDHKGRVVGFSGRDMGDKGPKYLNTGTTEIFSKGSLIYNPASRVKNGQGEAQCTRVVVEGHMDAISALNRGFTNVVAQMGTALTEPQLALLCRGDVKRLIFCMDKDKAGQDAFMRGVIQHAHAAADKGVSLYVMTSPHGKDPDDCFREKPELWQAAVDAARPAVEVLIEKAVSALPEKATSTDKQAVARRLTPLLKGSNALLQEDSLKALAAALGYSLETMQMWTDKQPDLRILPKTSVAKPMLQQRVTIEEWVLFYLINFYDDLYLGKAATRLVATGSDYTYFGGLMPGDFTHPLRARLMMLILSARKQGADLVDFMADNIDDSELFEMYQRCQMASDHSRVLGMPCVVSFDGFLSLVFELRIARIERDIAPHAGTQVWFDGQAAITLLMLEQEGVL